MGTVPCSGDLSDKSDKVTFVKSLKSLRSLENGTPGHALTRSSLDKICIAVCWYLVWNWLSFLINHKMAAVEMEVKTEKEK